MLTRLLSRRGRQEEDAKPVEAAAAVPTTPRRDSLLLFIPESGGMSFRLFTVQDEHTAGEFLRQEFPQLGGKPLLFQPFRHGARVDGDQQGEVLVVIADPSRPGTVYLSSFEDTDAAESFARFEVKNGIDPSLVTVHPGMPITIDTAPASGPYSSPLQARPAPPPIKTPARTAAQPTAAAPPEYLRSQAPSTPGVAAAPVAQTRQPSFAAPAAAQPRIAAQPPAAAQPKAQATAGAQAKAGTQARPAGSRQGIIDSIRTWPGWDTLQERMKGAVLLKWETYDEMRTDPIGDSQARVIVAAAAAAAGIGAFWAGPLGVVLYSVAGLVGWFACAYLTHLVGTVVFPGRQSPENKQLLFKALAFANAPRLIVAVGLVLGAFLPLMPLIVLGLLGWSVVAMVLAIEYSLEIDRQSATLTALTSGLTLFAVSFVLPSVIV